MSSLDAEFEGLDEAGLKQLLDQATDYDRRSKIRAAIRELKKMQGKSTSRRQTGSSLYRRPGFQAPKSMAIPNSVTGNVLPSKVSMETITTTKHPDPNLPTISYLGAKTVVSPSRSSKDSKRPSTSSVDAIVPREGDQENWWKERQSVSSSRSISPSSDYSRSRQERSTTPEREVSVGREKSVSDDSGRVCSPDALREATPEPAEQSSPEPIREPSPAHHLQVRTPSPEPAPELSPSPRPDVERTPSPAKYRSPTPEPEPEPYEPEPEPYEPEPEPCKSDHESDEPEFQSKDEGELDDGEERYDEEDREDEEMYEDEEEDDYDEEVARVTSVPSAVTKIPGISGLPLAALTKAEPGLGENKDFRQKLRKADNTTIDTKAAFPQKRATPEQLDFRNLLKKTSGPEKKDFKTGSGAQLDFRSQLKPKDHNEEEPSHPVVEETFTATRTTHEESEPDHQYSHWEGGESSSSDRYDPDSYEARREARRRLREERHKQMEELSAESPAITEHRPQEEITSERLVTPEEEPERQVTPEEEPEREVTPEEEPERQVTPEEEPERQVTPQDEPVGRQSTESAEPKVNGLSESTTKEDKSKESPYELDSYEARREARRKAREEKLKNAGVSSPSTRETYSERKQREKREQAERMGQNKQKWAAMDQANDTGSKPAMKRQVSGAQRGAQQLLRWCQHKTRYYENVEVKDFSHSWGDGLALCAILHSFLPDNIDYDSLTPGNTRENFTVALRATQEAGIEPFFDVEDMVMVKIPDSKSMMTFLATIYQHFQLPPENTSPASS